MNKRSKSIVVTLFILLLAVILSTTHSQFVEAATPKLSKTKVTLAKGGKTTLKVTGTKKKVKWSSSNKNVATVTGKGVVKAKAVGTAKITTKVGKKKLVCRVTVRNLRLNKTSLSISKGQKYTLKFIGKAGKAKWSTSDKSVATVTQKGVVRGIKAGNCRIRANAYGKTFSCILKIIDSAYPNPSAVATVTPTIKPTSVPTVIPTNTPKPTDSPAPTNTPTGSPVPTNTPTGTPEPTARPTNTPEPTITDRPTPTTAPTNTPSPTEAPFPTNTPTPEPKLTLNLSSEYQKIRVNNDGSLADSCSVYVESVFLDDLNITDVESWPASAGLLCNASASIGITGGWDNSSKAYTVYSLNRESGYVDITVKYGYGKYSCTKRFIVEKDPDYVQVIPVESLHLNQESLQLYEEGSEKLTYSIFPENATDKAVEFSSSDEQIATVLTDGTVEAKTSGYCTITATCGEIEAKCVVEILKKEIILDKDTLILAEGTASKVDYEVHLPDSGEQEVVFLSSDENIVQTKSNGMIFANSVGECSITIECQNVCAILSVKVINEEFVDDAKNGISYKAWPYGKEGKYAGGVIVSVVNNNDYSINVKSSCRFYDESGNLTGDLNAGYNSNSCLEPGNKSYLHIYGPYMPPKYEVYFEVSNSSQGGHSSGIEIEAPEVVGEYRQVYAEIKNISSTYSKYTRASCIFYKEGVPIEVSYTYPQINYVGASEIMDFSSSNWDKYDSFRINLEYSHT